MEADELAGRIDGVARVLMALIADLEMREQIDGGRFCRSVRASAAGRRRLPEHEVCAQVMEQIADQLDAARASRQSSEQEH